MRTKEKRGKEIPFVDGLITAEIQNISIEDILFDDKTYQYRLSTNVRNLRRSLFREGQREPVDLMGGSPYRIINGFRRVEAIRSLDWLVAKAIVPRDISQEEAHKIAFIKNVVRKNPSPMERANAIYQARRRGMEAAEIAEQFGLSEKQLSRHETML